VLGTRRADTKIETSSTHADASRPTLERLTLERLTVDARVSDARADALAMARPPPSLGATASCYFPVIYRMRGRRISIRSRVPGERSETRDPGATQRIGTRIHVALRACYAGSRLSFRSRKNARCTRPGHEAAHAAGPPRHESGGSQ